LCSGALLGQPENAGVATDDPVGQRRNGGIGEGFNDYFRAYASGIAHS
jgi:hypothetical protein